MTREQVIKRFLAQEDTRGQGRECHAFNSYYERQTFYSYGRHWPLAIVEDWRPVGTGRHDAWDAFIDKHGRVPRIFINGDLYSSTTTRHLNDLMHILRQDFMPYQQVNVSMTLFDGLLNRQTYRDIARYSLDGRLVLGSREASQAREEEYVRFKVDADDNEWLYGHVRDNRIDNFHQWNKPNNQGMTRWMATDMVSVGANVWLLHPDRKAGEIIASWDGRIPVLVEYGVQHIFNGELFGIRDEGRTRWFWQTRDERQLCLIEMPEDYDGITDPNIALMPEDVRNAEVRHRQGEWYFVPAGPVPRGFKSNAKLIDCTVGNPINNVIINRSEHYHVGPGRVIDGQPYLYRYVKHVDGYGKSTGEHSKIVLGDDQIWKPYKNRQVNSFTLRGRAARYD